MQLLILGFGFAFLLQESLQAEDRLFSTNFKLTKVRIRNFANAAEGQ